MADLATFSYLSLRNYCKRTEDPADLLLPGNRYYRWREAEYAEIGKPDVCFADDAPHFSIYDQPEESIDDFALVTKGGKLFTDDVFIASLDNVIVQRVSLGRERFLLLLSPGVVAAESYSSEKICEFMSYLIKEKVEIQTNVGKLSCKLYNPEPVDTTVEEPCVMMSHMWMNTYFHWIIEALPRFWYLSLDPALAQLPVVLPYYPESSFQEQTLASLLPGGRRIPYPGNVVHFKKLLFPTFLGSAGYSRRQVSWLNETLRQRMGAATAEKGQSKIYISRNDAHARRVVNEDELMSHLAPRGFVRYTMSNLTVKQQIELFSTAETLVMVHGSACANLVFAPERARVIEILPSTALHPAHWVLSKLKGQIFGRVPSQMIGDRHDLHVDINKLLVMLDRIAEVPL